MKKVILSTVAVLLMGLTAKANSADQLTTVMTCTPVVTYPDFGLQLTVTTGGYAGVPMIHMKRFLLGYIAEEVYAVADLSNHELVGSPVIYKGEEVSLEVNFTTAPTKDGAHLGTLQFKNSTIELSCK